MDKYGMNERSQWPSTWRKKGRQIEPRGLQGVPIIPPWPKELGNCNRPGFRPDVMFPDPGHKDELRQAKEVCVGCPIKKECGERALEDEKGKHWKDRWGVWGGMSGQERAKLWASRSQAAASGSEAREASSGS